MLDQDYLEHQVFGNFPSDVDLDYDSAHYAEPGDTLLIAYGPEDEAHYRVTVQDRLGTLHMQYSARFTDGGVVHRELAAGPWYALPRMLETVAAELTALGVLPDDVEP